jgi:hypothetical protein
MAYSNYYLNQRLANLQYQVNQIVSPITGFVPINGDSVINNIKIFASAPPQTPFPPVLSNDLVNKLYVDSLVPTPIDAVLIDGSQTLGSGIKTFINLPQSSTVPTLANEFVNKTYVDSLAPTPIDAVLLDGSQTLGSGIKTFVNLPQSSTVPTLANEFVNKLYVDSIDGLTLNEVLTNTLPFTALQTFNSGITVNGVTSTFNKLIIANSGIQTNQIQSTNAFNITNTVGQPTNINTSLNVLGNAEFLTTSNFASVPTTSSIASANFELTNVQSVNNLIGINTPNFALRDIANTFTTTNNFILNPTTSAIATLSTQIPNLQQIESLIGGGGIGNATLSANPQTFTGQNIFNIYSPQTPIAPTSNNDLINLQYLNTQLTNLRSIVPLKALSNIGPVSGNFAYILTVNSWANYLINDFITIRYNLSNNYPFTDTITPSINTANSVGYLDIYPYRLGFGTAPFASYTNFNVINNTLNGSTNYNLNSTLPRGRWFWAYNQSNTNAPANGIYLYIVSVSGQQLNIGIYITSPTASQYTSAFNIELLTSLNSANISTTGFTISNF